MNSALPKAVSSALPMTALTPGIPIDASAILNREQQKQAHEVNKLEKRLARLAGQAIMDFRMIGHGDRIMVCLSGGKDSYTLLELLLLVQQRAPIHFELIAVNLDQRQPNFPAHILPDYLRARGVPFHIETQDTYSIVKRLIPEGKTTCSLCSRLRRGILYRVADELGATRIALGHHRDDIIETVFLNLFYGGKLKGMAPKLISDDKKHIVIRPLTYIQESDIIRYAQEKQFPIIPCDLCGSQENLKRKEVKAMLQEWQKRYPGRIQSIFTSLGSIVPSHLMDKNLYDFGQMRPMQIDDTPEADTLDESTATTDTNYGSAFG